MHQVELIKGASATDVQLRVNEWLKGMAREIDVEKIDFSTCVNENVVHITVLVHYRMMSEF